MPFKAGAFKIAVENQTQVVPMTFHIPLDVWNNVYPLNMLCGEALSDENKITITVHEPIQTTNSTDIEELKEKCYNVIYSALPPIHADSSKDKIPTHEKELDKKIK